MPGFRLTHCAPQVVTVHDRPAPLNQRSHVSACPARPSQAQPPARPGSPHRRYWSTRCMGTVNQPRSRVQRSGATHSRFCHPNRHRFAGDWLASVLAKWSRRGHASRDRLVIRPRTTSAALLSAKRVHSTSASRLSVRALERCNRRPRLASHRVDRRGPSQRMSHASLLHNAAFA